MRAVAGLLLLWTIAALAFGQDEVSGDERFVADIELQTSDQFVELLQRASQLLVDGAVSQDGTATVAFVLHGPVIRDFLRQNYAAKREVVDLAASLTALQVVDIKVCETWLGQNGLQREALQPFVKTVKYASGELRRLREEGNYLDF